LPRHNHVLSLDLIHLLCILDTIRLPSKTGVTQLGLMNPLVEFVRPNRDILRNSNVQPVNSVKRLRGTAEVPLSAHGTHSLAAPIAVYALPFIHIEWPAGAAPGGYKWMTVEPEDRLPSPHPFDYAA